MVSKLPLKPNEITGVSQVKHTAAPIRVSRMGELELAWQYGTVCPQLAQRLSASTQWRCLPPAPHISVPRLMCVLCRPVAASALYRAVATVCCC